MLIFYDELCIVLEIFLKCSGPVTFEVSTLLMLKIRVILIVMSSGRIIDYECFEGTYCLQNVGNQ